MNKIKAIKGTGDILPGEIETWQGIERVVREIMKIYGYSEIRTPIFEETGLFARSIGEDTDIVGKEMYTFRDKGNRSLTLRPEGTASVVRAFIEHSLDQKGLPQSLWYMGPFFRQERPQKGRQRQFHQFGVEVIGSSSPVVDAEVIIIFDRIAERLGLDDRIVSINSIGGEESRENYKRVLVQFLDTVEDRLCGDCRRRKKTNPLRVLDCKVPGCREVVHDSEKLPKIYDYLIDEDRLHYEQVKDHLTSHDIVFIEDVFLVRGFDYYTGTVFEMNYEGLGAQSAVMAGGRYDNLIKQLGGPDLPAVGFACGMERLVLVIETAVQKKSLNQGQNRQQSVRVFIVKTDRQTESRAFGYLESIRRLGFSAKMDTMGRSMKAQMKSASKLNAEYALIIEPEEDMVSVRNMAKSEQKKMLFRDFLTQLKKEK